MLDFKNILITGESGFIGSHLINHFSNKYKNYSLHGLDMLTYAANRAYTKKLDLNPNYEFHQIDICNRKAIFTLFNRYQFTDVIHLAAESHVDNSIDNPLLFVKTNIIGTVNLLDAFKQYSTGKFHHVSTDEVYGDLDFKDSAFCEKHAYKPSSPYSASKASSDHFVRAYNRTYGINTIITNCSNNYGPHQHVEKFIPTIIYSIANNKKIPIYGAGENIRDWLYVKDHIDAIDKVFHYGNSGETYNIGANNELSNIDLVHKICDIFHFKGLHSKPKELITFVDDRLGHDNRYAIDYSKLKNELDWEPQFIFEEALSKTIDWYIKQ